MNSHDDSLKAVSLFAAGYDAPDMTTPEVIGKIYDIAKPTERCRMLEHLIQPLGALALVGVCNGIFAKIWFRSGWQNLHVRPNDAQSVQGIDVITLADYVQQASAQTVDGLVSFLTTSPMMVYSAAAATLVTVLARRIQSRRATNGKANNSSDSALPPV